MDSRGRQSANGFLGIIAGAARRAALFPQFFPIPHPGGDLIRQGKTELVGEHADLAAMVGLVRNHVAEHFRANLPWLRPAVPEKFLDGVFRVVEGVSQHLCAASGTLSQCRTSLPRRATHAVQLCRNFQVRSGKPDPFAADIVHVGENHRDAASLPGRLGTPHGEVEIFDENLINAIVGGENLDGGTGELIVNLCSRRSHGAVLLGQ
jgi:hypothetical protein